MKHPNRFKPGAYSREREAGINWDGVPLNLSKPHTVERRPRTTKRYRSVHAHPLAYQIYLPARGSIAASLLGAREIKLR